MTDGTEIQKATELLRVRFSAEKQAETNEKGGEKASLTGRTTPFTSEPVQASELVDDDLKSAALQQLTQWMEESSKTEISTKGRGFNGASSPLSNLAPLIINRKIDDVINRLLDLIFQRHIDRLKGSVCGSNYSSDKARDEGFWIDAASESLRALGLIGVALAPIPAVIAAIALILAKYGHDRICAMPSPIEPNS